MLWERSEARARALGQGGAVSWSEDLNLPQFHLPMLGNLGPVFLSLCTSGSHP